MVELAFLDDVVALARPTTVIAMSRAVPGDHDATIDFRMLRRAYIKRVREGEVSLREACDAHRDLVRAAERYGSSRRTPCPICSQQHLRTVTYMFGPRLPRSGRCITTQREMDEYSRSRIRYTGYLVEVCVSCQWHHLLSSRAWGKVGRRAHKSDGVARPRRRASGT